MKRCASEQFHSAFKTNLDIERLPSRKFATNALVLGVSMLACNLLLYWAKRFAEPAFVELSRAAFGEMPQSQAQARQNRDAGTHVCRGQSDQNCAFAKAGFWPRLPVSACL